MGREDVLRRVLAANLGAHRLELGPLENGDDARPCRRPSGGSVLLPLAQLRDRSAKVAGRAICEAPPLVGVRSSAAEAKVLLDGRHAGAVSEGGCDGLGDILLHEANSRVDHYVFGRSGEKSRDGECTNIVNSVGDAPGREEKHDSGAGGLAAPGGSSERPGRRPVGEQANARKTCV